MCDCFFSKPVDSGPMIFRLVFSSRKLTLFLMLLSFFSARMQAQTALWGAVTVNTTVGTYNLGTSNMSRNVATDAFGNIYIITAGSNGILVSKSSDRGQTFTLSVQVSTVTYASAEPEIHVADNGNIYVAFHDGTNVYFSVSANQGLTYSTPANIMTLGSSAIHIASYQNMVYVLRSNGNLLARNNNSGTGSFTTTALGTYAFADVFTDPGSGQVTVVADNPNLFVFNSNNGGASFSPFALSPGWTPIYYSSYTQSDGPLGRFIFVAGGGGTTEANKINMLTAATSTYVFQNNTQNNGRSLISDEYGNLVDGYISGTNCAFRYSPDQGLTWDPAVTVAAASSHNIARNRFYSDIVVAYQSGTTVFCKVYGGILKSLNIPSVTSTVVCPGSTISVQFEASSVFTGTNVFSLELSDAAGSFTSSPVIGSVTSSVSGSIVATIPSTTSAGTGYKLRVRSSSPALTGVEHPVAIDVLALPNVSGSAGSPVICMNGTTSLSGSGAVTYTWSGGVTNGVAFSPTISSSYTVIGTAANTCTNSAVATITVNPLPVVTASVSNPVICMNATTSLSGGGASTYNWTHGVVNAVAFSPTASTNYTVTGTDVNSCTNTAVAGITVNPLPVVTASASVPAVCFGGTTSLSGGGANSYTWSGTTINGATFSPTATAAYTVTGSDANLCTNTAIITVTVNALPAVTGSASIPVICMNGTTTLNGSGASTYVWTGGAVNGTPFSPTITSNYTVTGTDGNNCKNTAVVGITVNPLPVVTASASNPVICESATTSLNGAGAVSYTWTGGVTNGVPFSPVSTASYIVTGTDVNGCSNNATVGVTVLPLPAVTASASSQAICLGGTVMLTGGGANSYTWSGGVTDGVSFIPGVTNTYSVTGTDASGCTNTAAISVAVNSLPLVVPLPSPGDVICAGDAVTLNGSGAASYTWSNGVTNGVPFIPTSSAVYTVIGTDANGCSNTAVINIVVNPLPNVNFTFTDADICLGDTLTLSGTGATTYTWSGGVVNGVPFSPTASASYSLAGTSSLGCTSTIAAVVQITVYPLPVISVNSGSICAGHSFELIPTGALTYTYLNGGPIVSPLTTTAYSVIGIDSLGCISDSPGVSTVLVHQPVALNLVTSQSSICPGSMVTITASGASSYTWNTGENTSIITASPSANTVFTASGTDANSCSVNATIAINVKPVPNLIVTPTSPRICLGSSITLNVNGADSVLWNTGDVSKTLTLTPDVTTSYTVKTTYLDKCNDSRVITVTVSPLPTVALGPDVEISAGTPYQLAATQTGAVKYSWSGGEGLSSYTVLNPELVIFEAQSYTLTVTSSAGCTASDDIMVNVIDDLVIANYMTPNGDGANDVWKVSNIYAIKNFRVEIIDSWGKSVYMKNSGYVNEFDANDVPDGVYYYFITDGSEVKYKGSITIIR